MKGGGVKRIGAAMAIVMGGLPVAMAALTASMAGRLAGSRHEPRVGAASVSPGFNSYRQKFPVSVAENNRRARKARNKLRSRGHHRKAVR